MVLEDADSSGCEAWPQLFAALQSHLAPIDIVRLCASSKAIRHFLLGILTSGNTFLARQLLLQAVQQAATCSRSSTATPWQIRRHNRTVKWLVHTANISPEILQLEAAEYFNVPNVPLAVCKQLVASGVEVSYDQLLSAAKNHVEGVENWITASKLVGKPARVTRLVEAVCCHGWQHIKAPMVSELSPAALADLLFIAINTQGRSSNYGTGIDEGAVDTLSTLLGCMRRSAAARQLSAAVLLQLLQSQVHVLSSRMITSRSVYSCMAEFSCLLNSAADSSRIKSHAVEQVLVTAVQQRLDPPNLQYLLTLQAVKQINAAGIARVLQAELSVATAYGPGKLRDSVVTRLCKLPAAVYASAEDCVGLCRALIGFIGRAAAPFGCSQWPAEVYSVLRELISRLRALQGMQDVGSAAVSELLQLSVQTCKGRNVQDSVPYSVVKLLCSVPAARAVSGTDLHGVLQEAECLGPAVCQLLRQLTTAW